MMYNLQNYFFKESMIICWIIYLVHLALYHTVSYTFIIIITKNIIKEAHYVFLLYLRMNCVDFVTIFFDFIKIYLYNAL